VAAAASCRVVASVTGARNGIRTLLPYRSAALAACAIDCAKPICAIDCAQGSNSLVLKRGLFQNACHEECRALTRRLPNTVVTQSGRRRSPTIGDIASLAGVSASTVSPSLSRLGRISEETREQ